MDHKVSKDMISSGMTPSGEKTQADLGRTQYGSAPSPSKLMDAYKSIYEHHQKDKDGNTIPHEGEELNEAIPLIGAALAGAGKLIAGLGTKAAVAGAGKAAAAGATKAAAAGATKAAAAGAGKAAGSTIAKGGLTKTITRAGIKAGGKTGGKIAQSIAKDPMGALNKASELSYKAQMVGSMIPRPRPRVNGSGGVTGGTTATVSAGADLFDIVKGQLLDEGMSEEEIRDIMLTLTPDEIMSEMAVNPKIAAMDAKNKADMIARAKAKEVPQNVRDASKRQYTAGGPKDTGANKYTTQDKKTIINYNKNKESM